MRMGSKEIIEHAKSLRKRLFGNSVMVKASFNLTDPGCRLNCHFCSVSQESVGKWNKDQPKRLDQIISKIHEFEDEFKYPYIAELVAFWPRVRSKGQQVLRRVLRFLKGMERATRIDVGFISQRRLGQLLPLLDQYHTNLETSSYLYSKAVGHPPLRFKRKVGMLLKAYKMGIHISSGLLLGLGETWKDLDYMGRFFPIFQFGKLL